MEDEIECLCQKIWDILDVEKEKFVRGWRRIEEVAEEASSIPLNIRLILAAVGFYDPVILSTLTEKELEIAASCTCIDIGMIREVSCGNRHNCDELIRKALWGSYYNKPEAFSIKPGYKNVLLLISKRINESKTLGCFGRRNTDHSLAPEINSQTNNGFEQNNSSYTKIPVQPLNNDKNTYDILLRKINKWIMSKDKTCSKNYRVLNVKISSRGGAEITCPFCDNNIRATYHTGKWVTSNFQRHYEKHLSTNHPNGKKDQPAQDSSISGHQQLTIKTETENFLMETNDEDSEGDPLYF